ncbi:hypothetical protein V8G54_005000, partial [Vigna mungo]
MGVKNVTPDARSYCSKLVGLVREKKAGEVVEFVREMEKVGDLLFCINAMINAAMKGFVNDGNLDKAKELVREITNFDLDLHKTTYSILVPFLREKGDLGTTFDLFKEIYKTRSRVDVSLMQLVVDKLVD